jgi:hypothetical protein
MTPLTYPFIKFLHFVKFRVLHLARVHSNTSLGDDMTEEWILVNPELTLAELGIQLVLSQPLQHELQMLLMLCL